MSLPPCSNWFVRARFRLAALLRKDKLDAELETEMRLHIEMQTEENIASGMKPSQARAAALRDFGWTESIKERCRDQRGVSWIENLASDIRYAARGLRRSPAFAALAVITLAFGIGANTVVFSVARLVLLRSLGFDGEDRLMWIRRVNTSSGAMETDLSWQDMEDIRTLTKGFDAVATFGSGDLVLEHGDRREVIPTLQAPPSLADALRVRPILGRMLEPSDAKAGDEAIALISYEAWQSRYGGRPEVLGQTVRLDGKTRTIIGVLPAGFHFPLERSASLDTGGVPKAGPALFWLPMSEPRGQDRTSRSARMFSAVGRLKPGVTEQAARVELAALGKQLAREYPESNRQWGFTVESFRDHVFGRTRQGVPLLAGAVAGVLIICCVNLANLLLARSLARQREIAVRLALGAGPARLFRSLLVENSLLAMLGGGTGVLLAIGALRVIRNLASASVPYISEATIDAAAITFTAAVSLLTALTLVLIPTLRLSRTDAADALRTGARATGSLQLRFWQQTLMIGQIAVVLVLLASSGLLLESFRRLIGQDLGYQPSSVIVLDLSQNGFETNGDVCRMYRRLRDRVAALPGVEAVGTISSAPLTGKWTFDERPNVVGRPVPEADRPSVAATFVAFDYFQAMGVPLLAGRYFRDAELNDDGYGQVVILNEAAATLLFPGRSAVGGRFTVGSNPDRILEVIGVVKDTRDVRLEQKPQPRFYWQYAFGGAQVVVRGTAPPGALMPMLREVAGQIDARVRINSIRPLTEIVASTVADRRFLAIMVTIYTSVALAIASTGIFGVVSYQVARRQNEFGVRLALGASPRKLIWLVLLQAGRVTLVGLAIGLGISLATNRLLASQIFDLSPHNPILLASVSLIIFLVAVLAASWPARRAASVDPVSALRCE